MIVIHCSAVIVSDAIRRVLMVRRRGDHPRWPGVWCLPGGQVETVHGYAELPAPCARRELYQETGVRSRRFVHLTNTCTLDPQGRAWLGSVYLAKDWIGPPENREPESHDTVEFRDVAGALASLPLMDGARMALEW